MQKSKLDESGIEPETSPMLRERATNYATRPNMSLVRLSSLFELLIMYSCCTLNVLLTKLLEAWFLSYISLT